MPLKKLLLLIFMGFISYYAIADSTRVMYKRLHYESFGSNVVFSPDGKLFLTASVDKNKGQAMVNLWDFESGQLLHTNYFKSCEQCYSGNKRLVFSPDGTRYLFSPPSWNNESFIIEIKSGKVLLNFKNALGLSWSPDGTKMLFIESTSHRTIRNSDTLNQKAIVAVVDANSGEKIHQIRYSEINNNIFKPIEKEFYNWMVLGFGYAPTGHLGYSSDGKYIFLNIHNTETHKQCIIILNAENYTEKYRIEDEQFSKFIWNGSKFIAFSDKIYETETGKLISDLASNVLYNFQYIDGDSILLKTMDYTKKYIINIKSKKESSKFDYSLKDGDCHGVYNPENWYSLKGDIFYFSNGDTVKKWNWKTGELLNIFIDTTCCFPFIITVGGKYLISYSGKRLKKWETYNGKLRDSYPLVYPENSSHHNGCIDEAFLYNNGKSIHLSTNKGNTKIDIYTGKINRQIGDWESKNKEKEVINHWHPKIYDSSILIRFFYNHIYIEDTIAKKHINVWLDGKRDWLITDSDGNYNASKGMKKKIYFVKNNEILNNPRLKKTLKRKSISL